LFSVEIMAPVVFSPGKQTVNEYHRRKDSTTTEQLTRLLKSSEYTKWIESKWEIGARTLPLKNSALLLLLVFSAIVCGFVSFPRDINKQPAVHPSSLLVASSTPVAPQQQQQPHHIPSPPLDILSLIYSSDISIVKENTSLQTQLGQKAYELDTSFSLIRQQATALEKQQQQLAAAAAAAAALPPAPQQQEDPKLSHLLWKELDSVSFKNPKAAAAFASMLLLLILAAPWLSYVNAVKALKASQSSEQEALKEAESLAFAKDTAEQSINMLEKELQRVLQQLGEAQRMQNSCKAVNGFSPALAAVASSKTINPDPHSAASSPRIQAATSTKFDDFQSMRGGGDGERAGRQQQQEEDGAVDLNDNEDTSLPHSPGAENSANSLLSPPPPSSTGFVEKYLKDRNAIAVEEKQLKEWLELEEGLPKLHKWLENAEQELQRMQKEVANREQHCKVLMSQLADANIRLTHNDNEAKQSEHSLRQQNLALIQQVQTLTEALEEMQNRLSESELTLATATATQNAAAGKYSTSPSRSPLSPHVESFRKEIKSTQERLARSRSVRDEAILDLVKAQIIPATAAAVDKENTPAAAAAVVVSPLTKPSPSGAAWNVAGLFRDLGKGMGDMAEIPVKEGLARLNEIVEEEKRK